MFIETFFGTSSSVKILRTLSEIPNAFTIEELQKETGLSRGIVHKTIKRLLVIGLIVEIEAKGKLKAFRLNVNYAYYTRLTNLFLFEKQVYRRNVVLLNVWNNLESLVSQIANHKPKLNVILIMLFGSQARGTAAVTSDVDLLIVTKNTQIDNKIEKKLENLTQKVIQVICMAYSKKLFAKINPVIMPLESYIKEYENKTQFMDQINRGNIVLFGDFEKILKDRNTGESK